MPLARRLAAAVTLLSVLLGTLGWAHPCAAAGDAGHAHGAAAGAAAAHCVGDARETSRPTGSGPTAPDAAATAGCAVVAHCATWVPNATVVVISLKPPAASAPRALREAPPPLGPDAEPALPPPRA